VGTSPEPAAAASREASAGCLLAADVLLAKVPNYRLYFAGQSISLAGTWMQMTAQSWLVLTLTHSPTDLGFVVALQTAAYLVSGPLMAAWWRTGRQAAADGRPAARGWASRPWS